MSLFLQMRPADDMPAEGPTRVLVVLERAAVASLSVAANDQGRFDIRVETVGLGGIAKAATAQSGADVLVIEVDPDSADSLGKLQAVARDQAGRLPVIAAVRELTVAATRAVLRAGAADVLSLPFSEADLAAAIEPALRDMRAHPPSAAPASVGRIISILGARGGVGATALATQAATLWAAQARVCLIDLDVQAGNAALYLDLAPQLGLLDVVSAGPRLDAELLSSIAESHASGVDLIGAPADVTPLEVLSPTDVDTLLTLAAQRYDIVLVDLPKSWTAWSLRAMELSDVAVMVTTLSVAGLHQTKRQLAVIEANGLAEKLKLLVNRVEQPVFGKIDLSETQSILGRKIDFVVADDAKTMDAAVELGKPLAKIKGGSRVEKDIKAVIAGLTTAFAERPAR